jgi:predicted DNA-binding antitoxin AbrB/MazE fold protein
MSQVIEAVFENGCFRLIEPKTISLHEGQNVRLTIETEESGKELLALAAEIYKGLSEEEIKEVEKIALDRKVFFDERK